MGELPPMKNKRIDLQWQILIGIVAGIVFGLLLNYAVSSGVNPELLGGVKQLFTYGGDIFLRLLRMVIVPLVFSSIFMAVVNLGAVKELGKIGVVTILYYVTTTAVAVLVGLLLVNIIHPGHGIDPTVLESLAMHKGVPEQVAAVQAEGKNVVFVILNTLINIIPDNAAAAFAHGDILQIIFFSIFCALIAGLLGKKTEPLKNVVSALDLIMQKAVSLIMIIAPYCIFFLVCSLCMDLGFSSLAALARYAFTVIIGLAIHSCICLPLLVVIFARRNPLSLMRSVMPALLTAWSTASSAATLPLTMECLKNRAKIDERIGNFVAALGATINMDGTALYESVAVIFIAELMGIPLPLTMQVVVFITATLAAIGAAAIPGAGMVTMGIVLSAVGLPLEGIGLILVIDRVLDQFRTAVNVWGDVTAAAVVNTVEGRTVTRTTVREEETSAL